MTTRLIDTHCHLEMDVFENDRDETVNRARNAGIEYIINIGADREGSIRSLQLCGIYPDVYTSVGLHPHEADTLTENLLAEIKTWAKLPKVIAIGEIGLDYHYMHSPKAIQMNAFRKQIAVAKEAALPVIVHSREAKNDTIEILREEAAGVPGVLHCFSGDKDMARRAMDMGFHISVAGPVTFKNAKNLREIARFIPDERLLIETDAPYLSPVPVRGKRNEPAFLLYTAQVVAELRGVTVSDIARITSLNAGILFKIGGGYDRGKIAYRIRDSLYLNITNRCTNRCGFCVKFHTSYVKGHNLSLGKEPSADEIISAIGNPAPYREIVFCGLGEPLLRLDVVKAVSAWVKQKGGRVRINTNGHGNLIHGRNILPELQNLVDSISISLDADTGKKYELICRPIYKNAFQAVIEFIREAKKHIAEVKVTVVDIPEIDMDKCRSIAKELGVELRAREFNVVG